MEIKNNVNLSSLTSMKIGGIAKKMFFPENEDDIKKIFSTINEKEVKVLSGGSNLLINDKKIFPFVINMKSYEKRMDKIDKNRFYISASCRIQTVINYVNNAGFGGFEEYYSLPALFGGMIYMNAGIGGKSSTKYNLSDFLIKVKVYDLKANKVIWLEKKDCDFSYRHSIFQNNLYIILGRNY